MHGDYKFVTTQGPNKKFYSIIGQNVCAIIKDCSSVIHASADAEKLVGLDRIKAGCAGNLNYNAKVVLNYQTGITLASWHFLYDHL